VKSRAGSYYRVRVGSEVAFVGKVLDVIQALDEPDSGFFALVERYGADTEYGPLLIYDDDIVKGYNSPLWKALGGTDDSTTN
jgi:hypothetical protein